MPISPTRFSRVSMGWLSSTQSLADKDPADTGAVFSVTGPGQYTGTQTITGAQIVSSTLSVGGATTFDAAATFLSTATFAGNVTATSGLLVGNAAAVNELVAVSSVTASVDFPAVNPLESSSLVTFGMSGLTRGDTLIVTPDSAWAGTAAHTDLAYFASSSSTLGEGNIWAINSTLTAVNGAATVFRFTRINHPSYI